MQSVAIIVTTKLVEPSPDGSSTANQ